MPSWNSEVEKMAMFLGKVGWAGVGKKEGAGGSTTTTAGSSTFGSPRWTEGAQAERVTRAATVTTETMVAPLPMDCRAMEAPSSRWKIR